MAIEAHTDRNKDFTHFVALGQVTFPELRAIIQDFYENGPTAKVLFDFTRSNFEGLSAETVNRLAILRERMGGRRVDGKTALVASRNATYGLLRMFGTMSESDEYPYEVRVFREIGAAREWLRIGESCEPGERAGTGG